MVDIQSSAAEIRRGKKERRRKKTTGKNYTVLQKSDAKIEITLTMTDLIRIKYPLSNFNYCLSGANVVNFNKIYHTVSE